MKKIYHLFDWYVAFRSPSEGDFKVEGNAIANVITVSGIILLIKLLKFFINL